ncbi:MAG TPA: glycosyltransferase, partial [Caulobacteraceae bacterium]
SCSALLSTSICEGFGLPLVEASHHELPVIARDIPVFREIMEDQAHYFSGNTSQELADAIKIWLTLFGMDAIPKPKQKKWLTWEQSAKSLIDLVLEADSDGWIRQHHANHGDS